MKMMRMCNNSTVCCLWSIFYIPAVGYWLFPQLKSSLTADLMSILSHVVLRFSLPASPQMHRQKVAVSWKNLWIKQFSERSWKIYYFLDQFRKNDNKSQYAFAGNWLYIYFFLNIFGRAAYENLSPRREQWYYLTTTPEVTGCPNTMKSVNYLFYKTSWYFQSWRVFLRFPFPSEYLSAKFLTAFLLLNCGILIYIILVSSP